MYRAATAPDERSPKVLLKAAPATLLPLMYVMNERSMVLSDTLMSNAGLCIAIDKSSSMTDMLLPPKAAARDE